MKNFKLTFLLTILMSMVGARAFAHDIEIPNDDGVMIYYNFINDYKELAVTYLGFQSHKYNEYSNKVVIPRLVEYGGKTYSVTSIGNYAFEYCYDLTSVIIPNSVTSISSYAFHKCFFLTSITIPNSVTSIGSHAFDDTAWYNNQPDGLVYAGKVAYSYKGTMPANTAISIKNGTLGIAGYAFYDCYGLTSVTIPNSVTSIGECAFDGCFRLTSVTIPNSVTSIGESAFSFCSGLTSITIPNSVTTIGGSAFSGCTGLTSVTIPNSVTTIGGYAFSGCTGLTSVTIPSSVTSIGERAFYQCFGLTSVTIPNSVTSIGSHAFYDCSSLRSVTALIPTPVAITLYEFPNRKNATLYVPKGSKKAYQAADYWKEFKEIVEIDVPSDVEGIECDKSSVIQPENGYVYTINGVRIKSSETKNLPKGIYIINGKKVIIK